MVMVLVLVLVVLVVLVLVLGKGKMLLLTQRQLMSLAGGRGEHPPWTAVSGMHGTQRQGDSWWGKNGA